MQVLTTARDAVPRQYISSVSSLDCVCVVTSMNTGHLSSILLRKVTSFLLFIAIASVESCVLSWYKSKEGVGSRSREFTAEVKYCKSKLCLY